MRITNMSLSKSVLRNIQNNAERLYETNRKLTTGKRVLKPSDDPLGIASIMRLRRGLGNQDQYKKNISTATGYLNTVEGSLSTFGDVLHRVRELVVQGISDSNNSVSRNNIADEIDGLRDQLGSLANTKFAGKYIFGGISIATSPYDEGTGNWQLPAAAMKKNEVEISDGANMVINVDGSEIFDSNGVGRNVFDLMDDISADLRSGNGSSLTNTRLNELEDVSTQLSRTRSYVGVKMTTLENIEAKNDSLEIELTEGLSNAEDADMIQTITEMQSIQGVYQASLKVGANIMNTSLLDFI